uniref:ribosomal protein S7 n=1 Tax=Haslea pseudostrearia TaxID=197756 RepID=UPI00220C3BA9|nr:ribosomal protein S7 [Haslea pseudostrearia]UXN44191.1 ribosomal protein S7 [Haslea pseudostrearia]
MSLKNKSFQNKLKSKIINHFIQKGNKETCENLLGKSLKLMQKSQVKSHAEIIKLAVLNTTPVFRVIELKEKLKKKKKKGTKRSKEIPAFLSHYTFRTSRALRFMADSIKKRPKNSSFSDQLHQELVLASQNNGESVKLKTETQKQALKRKFYFKYYRW